MDLLGKSQKVKFITEPSKPLLDSDSSDLNLSAYSFSELTEAEKKLAMKQVDESMKKELEKEEKFLKTVV